jgi:radical SAM superfamily enzyme YgiQ (UPF0313 family)
MIKTNVVLFNSITTVSPTHKTTRTWGVHRIATEIRKQGFTCRVINFINSFSLEEINLVLDTVISDDTKIVGFSSNFWAWYDNEDLDNTFEKLNYIIDYVRNKFPNIKIIAGGTSSTFYISTKLKKVNAIFQGFAENSLIKYLKAIEDNKSLPLPSSYSSENENSHGNIPMYSDLSTDVFDFNESQTIFLPEDIIDFYDFPTIEIGRGCIFKCSFCAFLLNGKKKLDYIKYTDILREEFTRNYNDYGIKHYIISDDTFNDSTEKLVALHSILTSLPFKVKFVAYIRLDLLYAHQEQISLLKEMGLIGAMMGIETFHKKAGSLVGKAMDSDKTKKFLDDLKRIHWGNEIKISAVFITGIPHETIESYEETIKWITDENNLIDNIDAEALNIPNPATIPPGAWTSEFTKNSEKYGFYWTEVNARVHSEWHNSIGPIHTRQHAVEIADKIVNASHSLGKINSVYMLLKIWSLAQLSEEKISMDELLKMNIYEYNEYTTKIIQFSGLEKKYLQLYKDKLFDSLSLNN